MRTNGNDIGASRPSVTMADQLMGGDRRSIGEVNGGVQRILNDTGLFAELFSCMLHEDPLVRMRAADAVEKVTRIHPEYLKPHTVMLIGQVADIPQQEVRWHVAQMFPRLDLAPSEWEQVIQRLVAWFEESDSQIVQVSSLQALADLARRDTRLRSKIVPTLDEAIRTGSPAVKTRARKLLKALNRMA